MNSENNIIYNNFKKAIFFEKNNNEEKAIEIYNEILSINDKFKPALINLGSIYSRLQNFDKALDYYNKAIAIKLDYITLFNIGCIFYKIGDFKKAVISIEKSKKLKSDFILAIQVLGLSYSHLKNYKAAIKCFENILVTDDENSLSLTALCILYYESENFDKALVYIEKLEKLKINKSNISKIKAKTLFNLDKNNESKEQFFKLKNTEKSFKIYNDFINTIPVETLDDRYGTIDLKIKNLEDKTKNPDNKNEKDLMALSLCCLFKGDTDSAINYLFQAKEAKF